MATTAQSPPSLREQIKLWMWQANDLIMRDSDVTDIITMVANALDKEHDSQKVYHSKTLIDWLRKQ